MSHIGRIDFDLSDLSDLYDLPGVLIIFAVRGFLAQVPERPLKSEPGVRVIIAEGGFLFVSLCCSQGVTHRTD